jgi:hypothetical protein
MEEVNHFDKRNPFMVPDGYFEDFAAKMDKLTQATPTFILPWYRQAKSWIAIAAAFAGIIIAVKVFNPASSPVANQLAEDDTYKTYVLGQLDEASVVDYLCDMEANDVSH